MIAPSPQRHLTNDPRESTPVWDIDPKKAMVFNYDDDEDLLKASRTEKVRPFCYVCSSEYLSTVHNILALKSQ